MKPLGRTDVFALLIFGSGASSAQQTSTVTANQLRLDLRFIGHPSEDVIPARRECDYFARYISGSPFPDKPSSVW